MTPLASKDTHLVYFAVFPNGKVYVGKTKNMPRRIGQHTYCARHGVLTRMAAAMRKYGTPEWWLIETGMSNDQANVRERYWISELRTEHGDCGYNLTPGGDEGGGTFPRRPVTEGTKRKMRASSSKSRPIVAFSTKEANRFWYFRSISEAARVLELSQGGLSDTLSGLRPNTKSFYAQYLQ